MPEMMLVRNDYDSITRYMFFWSEMVKETAERKGINPILVDGEHVTKKGLVSRLGKLKPRFVFLNGHGDRDAFLCHEGKEAIGIADAHLFHGSIVFARACDCLAVLGKEAVEKGCEAFVGYMDKFTNVRSNRHIANPLGDTISKPIWEASNAVALGLLKGKSVEEAIQASHDKTDQKIMELVYSQSYGARNVLEALINNDEVLTHHGNGAATIT